MSASSAERAAVAEHLRAADVVLVKGSNSVGLMAVADELTAEQQQPGRPDMTAKTVIPGRHHAVMEEPGSAAASRRIERSISEARIQLAQLVGMISLTGEVVHIVDGDRSVAAIVADDTARSRAEATAATDRAAATAAGWQRRIEEVRATVRRQQTDRIRALEHLLSEAWQLLDNRCPLGTDRTVDGARAAYREAVAAQRR